MICVAGGAEALRPGGNFAVESVAALPWNQWQLSCGISGSFHVELVATLSWNGWQLCCGIGGNFRVEYALNQSVDKKEYIQEEKDPSLVTLSDQNPTPSLSVPEKEDETKIPFASTLASNQDSMIDSIQASNLSLTPDALETIRKIVKNPGKEEVLYVRLSKEEKDRLADISYTYKRQGIRTSDNEVVRVAINALLEDYRTNGANSLLAILISNLHA